MQPNTILGIDPGTKEMGIAIICGRQLVSFGVHTLRNGHRPHDLIGQARRVGLAGDRTPLDDVIYDHLDRLTSLARTVGTDGHVLLYRVWWREAEIIPARALSTRLRRLRVERWLIRTLRAVQAHRWLLRPRYHGN